MGARASSFELVRRSRYGGLIVQRRFVTECKQELASLGKLWFHPLIVDWLAAKHESVVDCLEFVHGGLQLLCQLLVRRLACQCTDLFERGRQVVMITCFRASQFVC